jgi:hypothetical protein
VWLAEYMLPVGLLGRTVTAKTQHLSLQATEESDMKVYVDQVREKLEESQAI